MAKAPAQYRYDTEGVGKSETPEVYELPDEYKRIRDYFNKVYNSPEYKKRRKDIQRWRELYDGELYDEQIMESDVKVKAQVNYIFSTIETLVPLLTDNKPEWSPRARSPIFEYMANLFRVALDYVWDSKEQDVHTSDVVKECMMLPAGIERIGYNVDEHDIEIELVKPECFCIAPGYADNWKAPWQGTKEEMPLSWVAENFPDKLDDVKTKTQDASSTESDTTPNSEKDFLRLEHEKVDVYTIWIKDPAVEEYVISKAHEDTEGEEKIGERKKYPNGRIIIMTDHCVLNDGEDENGEDRQKSPFDHGLPPYVFYYDYRKPHSVWGTGEPKHIEELHREYNRQLRAVLKQSKLHHDPNYTYDENANLPENVTEEFEEGGHMWEVSATLSDKPPIQRVEVGDIDPSLLMVMAVLADSIGEVSSVKELMKGEAPKKERQSASEISVMIESSYTRVRQKVRNLEGSLKRRAKLIVSLMQQFYKTPRDVSFMTSDGKTSHPQYLKVANNAEMLKMVNMPRRNYAEGEGGEPIPMENDQEYQQRVAEDPFYQDTLKLIKEIEGDPDKMYWPFDVAIDTNSTLPMDKQTLANLFLRLAQIQVTPNSVIDAQAVIEELDIPNGKGILARKKQQQMEAMKLQAAQQGGGQRLPGPRPMLAQPGVPGGQGAPGVPGGNNEGGPTI